MSTIIWMSSSWGSERVGALVNLDYFDAHATGAWDWRGNVCPRV